MNHDDHRNMANYCIATARQFPQATSHQLAELSDIAKRLAALSTKQCNDNAWSNRDEIRRDNLLAKAETLAKEFGATGVEHSNDGRGMPLFIVCPSGYTNDLGQRGIIVQY